MYLELEEMVRIFRKNNIRFMARKSVDSSLLPPMWRNKNIQNLSVKEVIKQLWGSEKGKNGNIISLLIDSVIDVVFAISEPPKESISLCYIYQHPKLEGRILSCWFAPPPIDSKIKFEGEHYFEKFPSSYYRFLSIHNGFLDDGNGAIGFFPLEKLIKGNTIYNEDKNLLAFNGDGLGNLRCFDFSKEIYGNDFYTVDWDHESREIGDIQEFWPFVYDFIKKSMGL